MMIPWRIIMSPFKLFTKYNPNESQKFRTILPMIFQYLQIFPPLLYNCPIVFPTCSDTFHWTKPDPNSTVSGSCSCPVFPSRVRTTLWLSRRFETPLSWWGLKCWANHVPWQPRTNGWTPIMIWLVVWNSCYLSIQLGTIIPTDELIFFRGVGWNHQPVMVYWLSHNRRWFNPSEIINHPMLWLNFFGAHPFSSTPSKVVISSHYYR